MGIKFDVISVCCGDSFKDYDLVNLSAVEWFGLQYGRPDKVTHFGSLAEIKDDVASFFGDEDLVYITFSLGREGYTYETGTNTKRPMYSFGSLDRSSFKTAREMYLDIAKTLTEIVKREDENLLKRLEKATEENASLKQEVRLANQKSYIVFTEYMDYKQNHLDEVEYYKSRNTFLEGLVEALLG